MPPATAPAAAPDLAARELPLQVRTFQVRAEDVDEAARTVALSFSSETPVEQWWGTEILDHAPGSVRMDRLRNAAPVLVDHRMSDSVGVVESAEIGTDRVGRAVVRFGNSARAAEVFRDVVDGVRPHVSVGYRIHEMVLEKSEDGVETYRVLDWEPYEITSATIPADLSIGVGRTEQPTAGRKFPVTIRGQEEEPEVPPTDPPTPADPPAEPQARSAVADPPNPPADPPATPAPRVDVNAERDAARAQEQSRVRDIYALGDHHNQRELAAEAVRSDWSLSQFQSELLKRVGTAVPADAAHLGMDLKEVRRYSFLNVLRHRADPSDPVLREAAAFEIECSQEADKIQGKDSKGLRVPADVMELGEVNVKAGLAAARGMGAAGAPVLGTYGNFGGFGRRDLTVGTDTAGGYLKATDLLAGSFIELLVNATVLFGRSTILTGLVGDIAIPRHDTASTAYWVAEGTGITESQAVFGQVAMAPSTIGGLTEISRKLLKQSSIAIEAFVRMELARTIAIELDRVGIEGSGSGAEPEGILNATGIGAYSLGANGAVPTWTGVVKLEEEVAVDNAAIGDLIYLTNAKGRSALKRTLRTATYGDIMVWEPMAGGGGMMNGYPALVSNNVPADLTDGTGTALSALMFGNCRDALFGFWGGLDVNVDPYTHSDTGALRIVELQEADFNLRHVQSWAAIQDMDTT